MELSSALGTKPLQWECRGGSKILYRFPDRACAGSRRRDRGQGKRGKMRKKSVGCRGVVGGGGGGGGGGVGVGLERWGRD